MAARSWLSLVFLLAACDTDSTPDEAAAFVDATADVAIVFCECSLDDDDDAGACDDAADAVLSDDVETCIRDLVAEDPVARDVMQCATDALRELLSCYDAAGICPEVSVSTAGPGADEGDADEPISDDACGDAFEEAAEACGELPEPTAEALETCLGEGTSEGRTCPGEDC